MFYHRQFLWTCVIVLLPFIVLTGCEPSFEACKCSGELDDENICIITEQDLSEIAWDGGTWQSAEWTGSWLCFSSGMQLKVFHPLDRTPSSVLIYLAFEDPGVSPNSTFFATGDLARIVEVTEDWVILENNTNEFFYLRLVLA